MKLLILTLVTALASGADYSVNCTMDPVMDLGLDEDKNEPKKGDSKPSYSSLYQVDQRIVYFQDQDLAGVRLKNYLKSENIKEECPKLRDPVSLSRLIDGVARCFKIDSYVFAGMVRHESGFYQHATSPTGAVSLTQQTKCGIEEVERLLGEHKEKKVPEKVKKYFNTVVDGEKSGQKGCIEKLMKDVNGDRSPEWSHLDERGLEGTAEKKQELKEKRLTSLVYGAILLKQKIAEESRRVILKYNEKSKKKVSLYSDLPRSPVDLQAAVIKSALASYNGEHGLKERDEYYGDKEDFRIVRDRVLKIFGKDSDKATLKRLVAVTVNGRNSTYVLEPGETLGSLKNKIIAKYENKKKKVRSFIHREVGLRYSAKAEIMYPRLVLKYAGDIQSSVGNTQDSTEDGT